MTLHQVSRGTTEPPYLAEDDDEDENEIEEWTCPRCNSQRFEAQELETWGRTIYIDAADPDASYRGDPDYIDDQGADYDWACANGHYVYENHELVEWLNERVNDV